MWEGQGAQAGEKRMQVGRQAMNPASLGEGAGEGEGAC